MKLIMWLELNKIKEEMAVVPEKISIFWLLIEEYCSSISMLPSSPVIDFFNLLS